MSLEYRARVARRAVIAAGASGLVIASAAPALRAQQSVAPVAARHAVTTVVPVAPARLVLRGVTVVDVVAGRLRAGQTVVVEGNRIRAVGPRAKVRVPAGARVVDGRGKYLIPGLWEMHIHMTGEPELVHGTLIAYGITGMREMGNAWVPLAEQRRWREAITSGAWVGPRLLITGKFIDGVTTPAAGKRVVDSLKAAGADHIKLHDDGMSPDVFFAIAAEARRVGLRVIGHLPAVSIEEASDSGMRTIEHAYFHGWTGKCVTDVSAKTRADSASDEKCAAMAARLRRNGTWSVVDGQYPAARVTVDTLLDRLRHWPRRLGADTGTITLYRENQGKWPDWITRDVIPRVQRAGVPLIIAGHIAAPESGMIVPGFAVHNALAHFVEQGLAPLTALQAVTLNPAKYLDGTDSLGTVETGKLADLVLLDANPLEDIYNTQKIRAVIADGRYYDRGALDALLAKAGNAK